MKQGRGRPRTRASRVKLFGSGNAYVQKFNVAMSLAPFAETQTNSTWKLNEISRSRESFSASGTHFYRVKFPNPALYVRWANFSPSGLYMGHYACCMIFNRVLLMKKLLFVMILDIHLNLPPKKKKNFQKASSGLPLMWMPLKRGAHLMKRGSLVEQITLPLRLKRF